MFDFLRKPVFLIILAAALIIAGIWAYISNRNSQKAAEQTASQSVADTSPVTPTISNLTNIDSATVTEEVNAQLSLADAKAAEVDKKLLLSAIEVELPATMDHGSGYTYYIYATPNDKVNNWVIAISNSDNKFVRSRTMKEDFMTDISPINRSFLKTNYVAAIQVAEKNEGKTYREANTLTSVKLVLKNSGTKGWLYWFVDYISLSNQKEFQIDASNGAFVPAVSGQ